jgi:hypothetical protein
MEVRIRKISYNTRIQFLVVANKPGHYTKSEFYLSTISFSTIQTSQPVTD